MIDTYALTYGEEALCAVTGYMRQRKFLNKPYKNVNYVEGDIYEMWQHSVCAGAELAFARMIGLTNFEPTVDTFKSQFDIDGVCEVRYSFNNNLGLRFTDRDDKEARYVLIMDGLRHRTRRNAPEFKGEPYRAVGWIWGYEVTTTENGRVDQMYLHPMREFN